MDTDTSEQGDKHRSFVPVRGKKRGGNYIPVRRRLKHKKRHTKSCLEAPERTDADVDITPSTSNAVVDITPSTSNAVDVLNVAVSQEESGSHDHDSFSSESALISYGADSGQQQDHNYFKSVVAVVTAEIVSVPVPKDSAPAGESAVTTAARASSCINSLSGGESSLEACLIGSESAEDWECLIKSVSDKLQQLLPPFWMPVIVDDGISVCLVSSLYKKAIQRQISFSVSGDVNLWVHCGDADVTPYLNDIPPPISLSASSVDLFVERVLKIVNNIRKMEICSGADYQEFKSVWTGFPYGEVDRNVLQETRYSETMRSLACKKLAPASKWRCQECGKLRDILKRHYLASLCDEKHPSTANKYLTEGQKLKKLENQRKKLDSQRKKIERLLVDMEELINKEGVKIDEALSSDLNEVLSSQTLTPAQSVFLQQQVKASQNIRSSGMRWHPTMIRLALFIYYHSLSAYEAMRDSGMIRLPSSRTLYDYTNFKPVEEGIDKVALESLAKKVDERKFDYQKYHIVIADEIYISKNLVYHKSTGEIIGYTKLNEVDKEVKALEQFFDNPNETPNEEQSSRILSFMVKGIASDTKEVVASYGVNFLSVDQMYLWAWDVICALECSGVAVIAFVCDGSSVNRAFIKKHTPVTKLKSGVVFDTVNKASPDRCLYFNSDVAHLLKTIRNCFRNSRLGSSKGKRCMKRNGEFIVWDVIEKLYKLKRGKTLRKSYKLTAQHVYPDSFSCMKVSLAAQVLSKTVASDLEDQNWPNTKETVKCIETVNNWFDCLNGAFSTHGRDTRCPNRNPYRSVDDKRFEFLLSVLNYFEEWDTELQERPSIPSTSIASQQLQVSVAQSVESQMADTDSVFVGNVSLPLSEELEEIDSTPAGRRRLSHQTLVGIEMTTRAFIAATRFLLKENVKFINARVFSQDPLEQHFSKVRASGGGSTNPNVQQYLRKQRAIHMYGQLGIRKSKGNTQVRPEETAVTDEPLPKKAKRSF